MGHIVSDAVSNDRAGSFFILRIKLATPCVINRTKDPHAGNCRAGSCRGGSAKYSWKREHRMKVYRQEKTYASMLSMNTIYDVAVIGGGPAGMMAAGRAVERGLKVILLEKNPDLGKKLLISGGGRCNMTNAEFDNRALLAKFKDSAKFLFSAFAQHSVKETLEFFHSHGLKTKVEEGQRVFPTTDKAESVWDVLLENMKDTKHGGSNPVTVRSNAEVVGFETNDSRQITAVRLLNGEKILARAFILATGGKSHPETGSTGDGFAWLTKLGHTISPPTAALVPITVSDPWVKALSGVSLKNAKITLFQNGAKVAGKTAVKRGKVLFTHFGLSGPAILNMSSEVNELLKYGEVVISIDLLPDHDYATLNEALQKLFAVESNKKFKNAITEIIPAAFVPVILEKSGIETDTFCHSVTREERLALIKIFKDLQIHPTGLLGADKAIITSGGVVLTEVDFRTMQSRLVSNLYLIGDILNIDRPSGGYSLQLCWTTGWVAGNSI
jgi:predicted Rossmann fold flavoprotein